VCEYYLKKNSNKVWAFIQICSERINIRVNDMNTTPSMSFGNAWIGIWITSTDFLFSVSLSLMLCIRTTKTATKILLRPTESARSNYRPTVVMSEDNNILNLFIVSHNLHAIHEWMLHGRYENTEPCRLHICSTK
jgi:hypothetical protein